MKHCILLHLHYQDLWPECWEYLKNIIGTHKRPIEIIGEEGDIFKAENDCEVCYGIPHGEKIVKKIISSGTTITLDNKTFGKDPYPNNPKIGFLQKEITTDLYVTVNDSNTEWYEEIKSKANEIYTIENKGMDFGGFLYALDKIKNKDYITVTKIHGKKSLRLLVSNNPFCTPKHLAATYINSKERCQVGDKWRNELYLSLIGSKEKYHNFCSLFENDKNIFILGDEKYLRVSSRIWLKPWLDELIETENIKRTIQIEGAMFIASKKYLDLLFKNKEYEIFSKMENGYSIGDAAAHHLEHLICNCRPYGGKMILTN